MFNGYRVSDCKDARILETDGGDGCAVPWMYLMPLYTPF